MAEPIRVKIFGDHPWAGYTGVALEIQSFKHGIMPPMVKVRLDDNQDCPCGHECYAEKQNLKLVRRSAGER